MRSTTGVLGRLFADKLGGDVKIRSGTPLDVRSRTEVDKQSLEPIERSLRQIDASEQAHESATRIHVEL